MVLVTNGINNKIKYEGEHSPVPGIARKGWKLNSSLLGKEMPVSRAQKSALRSWSKTLQQNEGLMPNMINYGAHGRTKALADFLNNSVVLENGRGSIVFGTYVAEMNGSWFEVPVFGFSTGMGLSSAKIFIPEMGGHAANTKTYLFNGKEMPTGAINIIRVGTCGGCNFDMGGRLLEPVVDRPSLVNASFNLASLYSPLIETSPEPPIFDIRKNGKFARFWKVERNTDLVSVGNWAFLKNYNSPEVVEAIRASAEKHRLVCYTGGALSKGALAFEREHPEVIGGLRRNEGVFASEMEQAATADLASVFAKENGVKMLTGMIALIVGAIPGSGFPEHGNRKHDREVATGMKNALLVGLDALASLAFKEKND